MVQVFVRADKTYCVEVALNATVSEFLDIFEDVSGVEASEGRLVYQGKQLCNDDYLASADVKEGASLEFLGRLLGAGKKRKKKTYTKPKKNKHQHKNVKLRVLKYYNVDDSGKVTRLRKFCPNCGHGIFMATHHDRFHCGRCGMTYMYNKA